MGRAMSAKFTEEDCKLIEKTLMKESMELDETHEGSILQFASMFFGLIASDYKKTDLEKSSITLNDDKSISIEIYKGELYD
jgi:hypothetical protein